MQCVKIISRCFTNSRVTSRFTGYFSAFNFGAIHWRSSLLRGIQRVWTVHSSSRSPPWPKWTQTNTARRSIQCATHTRTHIDINGRWQLEFWINRHPRLHWCNLSLPTLHRRWSVGVAEHRVEGVSEVVGLSAVVLLRHWQQEGTDHQQEQEELDRQRHPQSAPQEASSWRRRLQIRREGSGSSAAARSAHTHTHIHNAAAYKPQV